MTVQKSRRERAIASQLPHSMPNRSNKSGRKYNIPNRAANVTTITKASAMIKATFSHTLRAPLFTFARMPENIEGSQAAALSSLCSLFCSLLSPFSVCCSSAAVSSLCALSCAVCSVIRR